jgi:predicted DNA binding CopG/RHH family protein
MKRADKFEQDMLKAYEGGVLKSISPSKADLAKFKAASSATFTQERRINIRLSSPDLMDIQACALAEGLPYQTFIASGLYKYVAGRLVEKPSRLTSRSSRRATKRRAA